MSVATQRAARGRAAAVFAVLFVVAAGPVSAVESKSVQTRGIWVGFDAAANTVTIKVDKPGTGKEARRLKKNQEASFAVKPEGSVLTRTTVTINGRKAELKDIPAGKTVNVYWRPDENDDKVLFARKIDVIFSDEELDQMYPDK